MAGQFKRVKIFVLLFFVLYFLVVMTKGCLSNRKVIARYEAVKKNYAQALDLNKELKQKVQTINSDSFIELTARKRLGLVKPGEIVYKIVEE